MISLPVNALNSVANINDGFIRDSSVNHKSSQLLLCLIKDSFVLEVFLFWYHWHSISSDDDIAVPSLVWFHDFIMYSSRRLAFRSHQFNHELASCSRNFHTKRFLSRPSRLWNSLPTPSFPTNFSTRDFTSVERVTYSFYRSNIYCSRPLKKTLRPCIPLSLHKSTFKHFLWDITSKYCQKDYWKMYMANHSIGYMKLDKKLFSMSTK